MIVAVDVLVVVDTAQGVLLVEEAIAVVVDVVAELLGPVVDRRIQWRAVPGVRVTVTVVNQGEGPAISLLGSLSNDDADSERKIFIRRGRVGDARANLQH